MAKEVKKEVTLYTHYLRCTKCSVTFSLDSPHSDNTKIGINKMRCPVCGKPVMLDPAQFPSGKISKTSLAKSNIEASRVALELAGKAKQRDRQIGEDVMVPVRSYQKGKEFGQTRMVPKKVIKSIEEKMKGVEIPTKKEE